jgi:hypothetical protein
MTGVIIWGKRTVTSYKERRTTFKKQEKMTCQESFYLSVQIHTEDNTKCSTSYTSVAKDYPLTAMKQQ